MKKSTALSYRSKRRRINDELQTHYSIFSNIESKSPINIDSNINNNSSNIAVQTSNVSYDIDSNIDYGSENEFLTYNIETEPQFSETLNLFNSEHLTYSNTTMNDNIVFNTEKSFNLELAEWAVQNKIPHSSLNSLLTVLRKHKCFLTLPKDARTILQTKPIEIGKMRDVSPGKYYHFGIESGIVRLFSRNKIRDQSIQEIKLAIGIDGLPISKSNSKQFWPILAYVRSKLNIVFLVGLYFGTAKPLDSNDYLKDFVTEAKNLVLNCILINNHLYKVVFQVFCCDTPAKSFVLKVKGHNGFFSCTRCQIEGEFKDSRLCFPFCDASKRDSKRTHEDYLNKTDINHHTTTTDISCVVEIPGVNVVSSFSLDYMHLVTLGVMKKLLLLWMKGPLKVRLPSSKVNKLSTLSHNLISSFACEFSRKPRALEEVTRWKATEFRSFLLYIGPVTLKNIVSDDCFKNFMALNIAMIILLSPDYSSFLQYADDLLNYFVLTFEQIYGLHLVSSNIHGLIHLVDDYKQFGPLDNCSTFPFENFMKVLKSMLRHGHKPLEQVVMRYNEMGQNFIPNTRSIDQSDDGFLLGPHNDGPLVNGCVNPQFGSLIFDSYKIKCKIDADSYFCTKTNEIVKLINIAHSVDTGSIVLIGRTFNHRENFYDKPIESSYFGIHIVKHLSVGLSTWSIKDIKNKVMILKCSNDLVAIPLIHSLLT